MTTAKLFAAVTGHLRRALNTQSDNATTERSEGGFTLIEVVVSFTLLIIIGSTVMVGIGNGIHASNATRVRTTASNVARDYIEQARSMSPAQVTAISPTSVKVGAQTFTVTRSVSVGQPGLTFAAGVTCATAPNQTGLYNSLLPLMLYITVTVSWNGASAPARSDTALACVSA
ncbi:hypothetical protein SAMN05892883_3963 [Jatrophihabitans sp. GAS493]|uniref:type IV pilus modification PilV family protein n=1 Tax=Jatrophihabitans sp. GAS493 TaxID=1907575 RepID=UPI000BB8E7EA|nr:type II secretion system protein [Jatrophihabitans sp. GAS493]SOD74772.1 hypothetical protein SAMN05892883_3963 [Jatrophihabitans sp. GAS493]